MAYSTKVALLANTLDYAGTDALQTLAGFRARARHPWLVGKIALALADIKKIDARRIYAAGGDGGAWVFTALGPPPAEGLLRAVEWDLREIKKYHERRLDGPCRLWIAGYETKLSDADCADAPAAYEAIAPTLDRFAASGTEPFFEVNLSDDGLRRVDAVADALSRWSGAIHPGIKVRTGGAFVPDTALLAEVIVAITGRGLRFKAAQGLPHAVTRGDSLGFVNLFAALAFAQTSGTEDVRRCLEESTPANFQFGTDAFTWSGKSLTLEQIEFARRAHAATFGSCSADEPDASLKEVYP